MPSAYDIAYAQARADKKCGDSFIPNHWECGGGKSKIKRARKASKKSKAQSLMERNFAALSGDLSPEEKKKHRERVKREQEGNPGSGYKKSKDRAINRSNKAREQRKMRRNLEDIPGDESRRANEEADKRLEDLNKEWTGVRHNEVEKERKIRFSLMKRIGEVEQKEADNKRMHDSLKKQVKRIERNKKLKDAKRQAKENRKKNREDYSIY